MAKVVILGAGLTGLSAAYHLEQKNFFDYEIFEKQESIGGLCQSITKDGFTFDYTGHLLHINDTYFHEFISKIVGFEHLNTIHRRSYIFSHNTYTKYPFQINLHGLPTQTIIECILGYVNRKKNIKNPKTFTTWVEKTFGSGFAKHFFLPYQEKIFAYPPERLSASWTGRFVPQTSLQDILQGSLTDQKEQSVGYNAQFFYPKRGGISNLIQALAQHIHKPIHTAHAAQEINLQNKTITFQNGQSTSFTYIINTIPLDNLLSMLKEKCNSSLKDACGKLKCNAVVNFNLGIARPNVSEKHWIYFPESKFPFYRLGFPHNFSEHMAPTGCSSLYGEFAFFKKDQRWVSNTLKKALRKTHDLLKIKKDEILTQETLILQHGYVIFDRWRDKNLPDLLGQLTHNHILSAGRYAQWKYSSMQEAVLDGKKAADQLLIMPAHKTQISNTHYIIPELPSKQKSNRT